jgi:hypothetical protein
MIQSKEFHKYFEVQSIVNQLRALSSDLPLGGHSEAFAKELVTNWEYGNLFLLSPSRYVASICREDVPKELQQGFGEHHGAVITPRSVTMFHFPDHLQEYLENRLLDVRDKRGEFAEDDAT